MLKRVSLMLAYLLLFTITPIMAQTTTSVIITTTIPSSTTTTSIETTTTTTALGVQYGIDVLEPGNPGGPDASLQTYDDDMLLYVGDEVDIDLWVTDIPEPLITAGFWLTFDPEAISIVSMSVYDGVNGPAGPWDSTLNIIFPPEELGPGTYLVLCANLSLVDVGLNGDIIMAKVRIRREKDVNSQLVVETIPPDFDTVVGEDGTVFDPQLVPSYLSLPIDICEGNFDGDRDQDGTDAFKFRTDFGRGLSYKPCPILSTTTTVPANYCPSDLAKCGSECIDTTTDESNCGGCGIICPGKCVGGTCQDECPPCPPVTQCVGTLSPLGRWCDQGNGTVKDMTTGLVWLKDAGWGGQKPWREPGDDTHNDDAHTRAGTLYDGMPGEPSDLSDGSVEGDWRLPTLSELKGITLGDEYIILSSQMYFFNNVRPGYWSSTTLASNTRDAWGVLMDLGSGYTRKDSSEIPGHYLYVWPVRGGQ